MTLADLHILTIRHGEVTLHHEILLFLLLCLIFGCARAIVRDRR